MNTKKPIVNIIFLEKRWEDVPPSWKEELAFTLEKAVDVLGKNFSEDEVSVVFADDKEVQELNKTFRHKNKTTNVLSFPSNEEGELGDIILSYETVLREAKEASISPLHHTIHLIVHGFLHLLGYDHENDATAHQMEDMEVHILKVLDIRNPYEGL